MGKIKVKTLGNEQEEQKEKELARIKREEKKKREAAKNAPEEKSAQKEVAPAEDKEEKKASPKKIHVRGKKYLAALSKVDKSKIYSLNEAVTLIKGLIYTSFDETVEAHINLREQSVKGELNLPHGTGKSVKVVIADDAVLSDIEKGVINFDVLLSTPAFMAKLVKFARVLGPKGLMPNPKNGTVIDNPQLALKKFSGGTIRFKSEPKFPLLHQSVGKSSFEKKQLIENIEALIKAVGKAKIEALYITSTMTPSVQVNVNST